MSIGNLVKKEIRRIAKEQQLPVFDKPDSQEICFIPSHDYPKFLEKEFGVAPRQGAIRKKSGELVGIHDGYFRYTVGQRRGLGIAAKERTYVTAVKPAENEVIVGVREDIYEQNFCVDKINWLCDRPKTGRFEAEVKIRSVHQKAKAKLVWQADGTIQGTFDVGQESVTPGQAAVFYEGARVLGGGWIR